MIEQEVKLAFDTIESARQSLVGAGGRLVVSRRLQDDELFDTADDALRRSGRALRIRHDGPASGILTFKGPVQPGVVKTREEIETAIGDPVIAKALFRALGYQAVFRAQKFREEYELLGAHVAIDETPIGVFVEIEGSEPIISDVARRLGRSPGDYVLDSYPRLYGAWRARHGVAEPNMIFPA